MTNIEDIAAETPYGLSNFHQWQKLLSYDRLTSMEVGLAQYARHQQVQRAESKLRGLADDLEACGRREQRPGLTVFSNTMRANLDHIATANEGVLNSIPPQYRRSRKRASLVEKLSSTPELLELILLQLPNPDLMRATSVCTMFRDNIISSAKVQRKLGFREDKGGKIYFPTHDFWFAELFLNTEAVEPKEGSDPDDAWIRIQVMMDSIPCKLGIGSKCRSMFICQPPIKSIQAYTSCCAGPRFWRHRPGDERPPAETIASETGITVGDIVDTTARLKESHKLCPDASPFDHNSDTGYVNAQVSFETTIRAKADDPLYVRQLHRLTDEKKKRQDRLQNQHRIDAYAAAKRTARDNGRPIPTMAEFEAAITTNAT
ncbi:hypothetical protein LTR86_005202 [Recurvomyces mirabilis]|nr:hypothetical protein LTR86_005202 [Recurvomyces mirabilis]